MSGKGGNIYNVTAYCFFITQEEQPKDSVEPGTAATTCTYCYLLHLYIVCITLYILYKFYGGSFSCCQSVRARFIGKCCQLLYYSWYFGSERAAQFTCFNSVTSHSPAFSLQSSAITEVISPGEINKQSALTKTSWKPKQVSVFLFCRTDRTIPVCLCASHVEKTLETHSDKYLMTII